VSWPTLSVLISDPEVGLEAGESARHHVFLQFFALSELFFQRVEGFPVEIWLSFICFADLLVELGNTFVDASEKARFIEPRLYEVFSSALGRSQMVVYFRAQLNGNFVSKALTVVVQFFDGVRVGEALFNRLWAFLFLFRF